MKNLPVIPPRSVCADGPRPCQWTECRHRLDPAATADWVMPAPNCALDVADRVSEGEEPPSYEVIGRWLGVTKERVRQIIELAYGAFIRHAQDAGHDWQHKDEAEWTEVDREIMAVVPPDGATQIEITEQLGQPKTTVRCNLARMARKGLVRSRPVDGRWRWFAVCYDDTMRVRDAG